MLTSVPDEDDAAFANIHDELVEHVFAIMALVGREPDVDEATHRAAIELRRTATRSTTTRGFAPTGLLETARTDPDSPAIGLPVELIDAADWPGREDGLSRREGEILVLVVRGKSNAEIAELVYLSANSIKSYIRSTYRKIGVTTRVEAVLWGVDHNFRPVLADDGRPTSACLSPSCP